MEGQSISLGSTTIDSANITQHLTIRQHSPAYVSDMAS